MQKGKQIYEGKGKILYETDSPEYLIQYFKDDATAFNARKKGTIIDKGIMNNKISAKIFEFLESENIPTHFEKMLNEREQLIKKVEMFPLEIVVRNIAAGSICSRLGLQEGTIFSSPAIEFCYKNDELADPLVNDFHIRALRLATDNEVEIIRRYASKINELLRQFFRSLNIDLVDFKLEFGKLKDDIILADEMSPDTCRLWEIGTGKRLDKDRFRQDLGNIEEAYQEILSRVSQ